MEFLRQLTVPQAIAIFIVILVILIIAVIAVLSGGGGEEVVRGIPTPIIDLSQMDMDVTIEAVIPTPGN